MEKSFHILHLEDSEVDAELIRDILEERWDDCAIDTVQTEAGFRSAIMNRSLRVILADYLLPDFDGFAALAIAREQRPDIPFIFVTGAMGEEAAIDTLKKGATDYVLKSSLTRLTASVERAVKEADDAKQCKSIEEDLRRRNLEIEQVIYTLSHNLSSPMVTIRTFLNFLEKDLAAGDAEQVATDVKFLQTAAERMELLLSELLKVSRVGHIETNHEPVSFQELVAGALAATSGQAAAQKVEVVVSGGDLTLVGDRLRLAQIWQNLLDNGIRYAGNRSDPCIRVGFEQQQNTPVFFVCDNGIGIDPAYHEKVFGLFEKLDRGSGGVGMGLAMVRRIVELYGGRVWVESAGEGQGCCFRFTLPMAVRHSEGAGHET